MTRCQTWVRISPHLEPFSYDKPRSRRETRPMTEVRHQPASAPRSTGIARTKFQQHTKSVVGQHQVSASPGAAQAPQAPVAKARPASDKGPIPGLSNEQIMLIGATVEAYRMTLLNPPPGTNEAPLVGEPQTSPEPHVSEMDLAQAADPRPGASSSCSVPRSTRATRPRPRPHRRRRRRIRAAFRAAAVRAARRSRRRRARRSSASFDPASLVDLL